jgi:hypothetical protein
LSSLGLKMFNAGEAEDATGLNYSWTNYQLQKGLRSLSNIFVVKISSFLYICTTPVSVELKVWNSSANDWQWSVFDSFTA